MGEKIFKVKIYTLSTESNDVFYVGATIRDIEDRLSCHISEARSRVKHESKYVSKKDQKIISLDFKVTATIVDIVDVAAVNSSLVAYEARDIERKWINKFLQDGCILCNAVNLEERKVNPQFIGKTIKAA